MAMKGTILDIKNNKYQKGSNIFLLYFASI